MQREHLLSTAQGAFLVAILCLTLSQYVRADENSRPLSGARFGKLHELIKPRAGESRWMEIDWYPSVHEARRRAAAEGKPIFLMAGSGGAPAAGC